MTMKDVLRGPDTSTLCTVREGSRQRDAREVAGVFVMFDKTSYSAFSSSESGRTLSSVTNGQLIDMFLQRSERTETRDGDSVLTVRQCPQELEPGKGHRQQLQRTCIHNAAHRSSIGSTVTPPSTPECRSGPSLEICRAGSVSTREVQDHGEEAHLDIAMHDTAQTIRDARRVLGDPRGVAASTPCQSLSHSVGPPTRRRSTTHLTTIASMGPIAFYGAGNHLQSHTRHSRRAATTNLVPLHRLREPAAPRLLLALDEHDKVEVERAAAEQLRGGARDRHHRALVVRRAAPVEVAVPPCECERVRVPATR